MDKTIQLKCDVDDTAYGVFPRTFQALGYGCGFCDDKHTIVGHNGHVVDCPVCKGGNKDRARGYQYYVDTVTVVRIRVALPTNRVDYVINRTVGNRSRIGYSRAEKDLYLTLEEAEAACLRKNKSESRRLRDNQKTACLRCGQ